LVGLLVPSSASRAQGIDPQRLARIDGVMQAAIDRGELPGAVVLVLHRGQIAFQKAYGLRARLPKAEPLTTDTLFDLASLTKPIATATSLFILLEQGKVRLSDRVAQLLPTFGRKGKEKITVADLLLHTGGLIADNPESDYEGGRAAALERINDLSTQAEPGKRFVYSDVGYIVLGELVEHLSGKPLDVFAREQIYVPLGMKDTGFRPDSDRKARAAPTQQREGRWMIGEVHDPRAYRLGGVAGHAGLFSTAADLAIYARMLLGHGAVNGRLLLSPLTVRLMTTPRPVPGGLRAYGWDVQTAYSSNRGELFPAGESFGHTGFTGTSIWIDPTSDTAVIFLSNRVHPDGKSSINRLRGQVATVAAAALSSGQWAAGSGQQNQRDSAVPTTGDKKAASSSLPTAHCSLPTVATGIDVLVEEEFRRLRGRRVGLVTNHSGLDRNGCPTIDLLHRAPGVTLVALFSPEHGIRGAVEEQVADTRDAATGLPIYSLYGTRRKPTAETLRGLDTLVYDIQDAGCRFYTYISTLGYVLEAAAEHGLRVVVLDRPNPISGLAVEGPILDAGRESFVGYHRLPVRHGMTIGELARLFNAERKLGADLDVVAMKNWRRGEFFDQTGLRWINPSPNLRSLTETVLYPGIGLLETTNLSVGRGTDRPFEWVGAPWIDGRRLAAGLAAEGLPGVRFVPLRLTPTASVHKGKECGGVQFIVDDWNRFEPLEMGLALAVVLRRLYPDAWRVEDFNRLLGHAATWDGVKRGRGWRELEAAWAPELAHFRDQRGPFLIYPE
jgi:uncharacterized protein YbbC (DUF1343 family)/CubicO group peptidase (beta-lactamase class C family)